MIQDLRAALDVITQDRGLAVHSLTEQDDGTVHVSIRKLRPHETLSSEYIRNRISQQIRVDAHVMELVDELYYRVQRV